MSNDESLNEFLIPSDMPFDRILNGFLNLSLESKKNGAELVKISSGYDAIYSSTPSKMKEDGTFTDPKQSIEQSIFTSYVPRVDVYSAIKKYSLSDEMSAEIKQAVDTFFPKSRFDESFPLLASLSLIFNDYLSPAYFNQKE